MIQNWASKQSVEGTRKLGKRKACWWASVTHRAAPTLQEAFQSITGMWPCGITSIIYWRAQFIQLLQFFLICFFTFHICLKVASKPMWEKNQPCNIQIINLSPKLPLQNNHQNVLISSCLVAFHSPRSVMWKSHVKTSSYAAIKDDAQTEILTVLQTKTAFLSSNMFCFYRLHVS